MKRREMVQYQTTHGLHLADDAAPTATGAVVAVWCAEHDAGAMPLRLVRRALRLASYGEDPADRDAMYERMAWADEDLLADVANPAAGLRVVELSAVERAR